jgi:LysM repeat protein
MISSFLIGLLASSVLTNSAPVTQGSAEYSFGSALASTSYSSYTVRAGEYLSMLADRFYGSEDYWTNIWNDNPEVENANQLEEGVVLKIRESKTILPEVLQASLSARLNTSYSYTAEGGAQVTQAAVVTVAAPTAEPVAEQPVSVDTDNSPKVLNEEQITYLGSCEAGNDPTKNTGNGYYGAFQFSPSTWNSMGTGYARADLAPYEVQKEAVQRLLARSSIYTQFPGCARKMRSIGLI